MLKALIRWLWPQEPPKRTEDAEDRYITRAEFQRELETFRKESTWLFDEWHEKFSTLHARLTKRAQRATVEAAPSRVSQSNGDGEGQQPLPSALNFRRPWSV